MRRLKIYHTNRPKTSIIQFFTLAKTTNTSHYCLKFLPCM